MRRATSFRSRTVTNTPNVLVVNPVAADQVGRRPDRLHQSATRRRQLRNFRDRQLRPPRGLAVRIQDRNEDAGRALPRRRARRGRRHDRRSSDGLRHAVVGRGGRQRRQAASDRRHLGEAHQHLSGRADGPRTGRRLRDRRLVRDPGAGAHARADRAPAPRVHQEHNGRARRAEDRSSTPGPRCSSVRRPSSPASSPKKRNCGPACSMGCRSSSSKAVAGPPLVSTAPRKTFGQIADQRGELRLLHRFGSLLQHEPLGAPLLVLRP